MIMIFDSPKMPFQDIIELSAILHVSLFQVDCFLFTGSSSMYKHKTMKYILILSALMREEVKTEKSFASCMANVARTGPNLSSLFLHD